jgi:hypothetical protein
MALDPVMKSMSQMGQSRHLDSPSMTSSLPRTTDIVRPARLVRFVPTADLSQILLANGLPLVQGKLGVIQLLLGSVTTARRALAAKRCLAPLWR